jgi:hypothetical protein
MACVSRPADTSWNRRFDSAVSIMVMRRMRWSTSLRRYLLREMVRRQSDLNFLLLR